MLFKDVVGQTQLKEKLIQTVEKERISHAQMFHGKLGYGVFPMVLAYAQYIFCQQKGKDDSCGTCPSCLKIKTQTHPDLHFSFPVQILGNMNKSDDFLAEWRELMVDNSYSTEQDWYIKNDNEKKKGIIGVHESQNLAKKISLKSFEGGYKISIIWLAENMNIQAANKLLKLIEEPPENTLIFLCVEDLEFILPTIISRTQIIKLNAIPNEVMVDALTMKGFDSEKANEVVSYTDGDFAMALTEISAGIEQNFYFDSFVSWMRLCFKKDVAGAIKFVAEVQKMGKEKQKTFLLFVLSIFQKSLVGNFVGIDKVKTSDSHKAFIEKFMPYIHERNIAQLHEKMSEAHYHIDRNANAKILFLDLSFSLFKLIKK